METMSTEPPAIAASFDAVQMMRNIRNQISRETADMTFLQLKEYMQKKLNEMSNQQEVHEAHAHQKGSHKGSENDTNKGLSSGFA